MYENELIDHDIWEIHELGQSYPFQVKELRTVKLNKDGKMKKLWLLAVEAPELEQIRERYGLASKLKGHDFHITLGYQVPGKACMHELNGPSSYWLIHEEEIELDQSDDELEAYPAAA